MQYEIDELHEYIQRMPKVRDYMEIQNRVYSKNVDIEEIGRIRSMPILSVSGERINSRKNILVTAGVHGNEPAGVYAALSIIDSINDIPYNVTVIPCVNPVGFEYDIRENNGFVDVNRNFQYPTESYEAKFIIKHFIKQSPNFHFTVDFHESGHGPNTGVIRNPEDRFPDGFYFWEICREQERRVGKKIISHLMEKGFKPCMWRNIFGDFNNGGVIQYPDDMASAEYINAPTFDMYLNKFYTNHSFTLESLISWDMDERIRFHKEAFHGMIKFIK